MNTATNTVEDVIQSEYKYGFVTAIEADTVAPGLNEDVIRLISAKKNEPTFMLEWRLKAYRHCVKLEKSQAEPKWANVHYPAIDYQAISFYSAPKFKADGPKSLEEVDPELLKTYDKLGISVLEQGRLSGIAVDAVFDSVSVATTFKGKLAELGIMFGSFSEAVQKHPVLAKNMSARWCPTATTSSPGVRCPMELTTYFRINAAETGQFERRSLPMRAAT